jgi:hypothetical protein
MGMCMSTQCGMHANKQRPILGKLRDAVHHLECSLQQEDVFLCFLLLSM